MKKLIQGEKISIENHHPNVPLVWDSNQDIHLHKMTTIRYGGTPVSVDVKISLNNDRKISIEPSKANIKASTRVEVRDKMIKEIREAFESPQNIKKRDEFLKDLIKGMNLINGFSLKRSLQEVENVFDKIMGSFGLSEPTKSKMKQIADEYFKPYSDDKREYYIFMKPSMTEIGELTPEEKQNFSSKGFE